ncbi:MAG TPA: type II toxin-antitoxin system VapC family toxin, partial [Bryobacteraceae bacterium]
DHASVRYLVDSDWLIDAFLGIPAAVNLLARLRDDGLAVSIISHGELFEGALGASDPAAELARFRRFLARLAVLSLDDPIMERFARIRAELRRRGQLIPDLDLLIAATATPRHDMGYGYGQHRWPTVVRGAPRVTLPVWRARHQP